MKKILSIVSVTLSLAVITSALVGCTTSAPAQDVPQYRADQVVYVVQAKFPTCYRYESATKQTLQATPSVTATYIGDKVWKVEVDCPGQNTTKPYQLYSASSYSYGTRLYFYEADGSLWGGYNADTRTLSSPR